MPWGWLTRGMEIMGMTRTIPTGARLGGRTLEPEAIVACKHRSMQAEHSKNGNGSSSSSSNSKQNHGPNSSNLNQNQYSPQSWPWPSLQGWQQEWSPHSPPCPAGGRLSHQGTRRNPQQQWSTPRLPTGARPRSAARAGQADRLSYGVLGGKNQLQDTAN